MLKELLGFGQSRRLIAELHAGLVARAREPVFFRDLAVADTIDGRFDMVVLHAWLLLARLNELGMRDVGQSLVDTLFTGFDESVRELGVGDIGAGHRVKKIADAFYGRLHAYAAADGDAAMAAALLRNIYRTRSDCEGNADVLARYVRSAQMHLAREPLASGRVDFGPLPLG